MIRLTQTTDSALAAAFNSLHHEFRHEDPAVWCRETNPALSHLPEKDRRRKEERCTYSFEENEHAPLSLQQITEAWRNPAVFDMAEQYFLSLVPESERAEASRLLHSVAVAGMSVFITKYKTVVIPLMNRSRDEVGLHVEKRGNKVLISGKNASEKDLDDLRREGNFV